MWNLKKEEILAGNTAIAERDLTNAILSRAKANAAVSKITENQGKIIDIEVQRLELRKQLKIATDQIAATEKKLCSFDISANASLLETANILAMIKQTFGYSALN